MSTSTVLQYSYSTCKISLVQSRYCCVCNRGGWREGAAVALAAHAGHRAAVGQLGRVRQLDSSARSGLVGEHCAPVRALEPEALHAHRPRRGCPVGRVRPRRRVPRVCRQRPQRPRLVLRLSTSTTFPHDDWVSDTKPAYSTYKFFPTLSSCLLVLRRIRTCLAFITNLFEYFMILVHQCTAAQIKSNNFAYMSNKMLIIYFNIWVKPELFNVDMRWVWGVIKNEYSR